MEWTRISDVSINGMKAFYNGTTLLKVRYPNMSIDQWNRSDSISSAYNTLYFHAGTYGDPRLGFVDSVIGSNVFCSDALDPFDFSEVEADDVEIYAFRDVTNPSSFLVNIFCQTENETTIVFHCGTDTSNVECFKVNTSKTDAVLDLNDFVTAYQSQNNGFGNDYIIQPLYVYDEKTPLFIISGNTTLSPFTLIQVQSRKFLVVGKGVCVEVD